MELDSMWSFSDWHLSFHNGAVRVVTCELFSFYYPGSFILWVCSLLRAPLLLSGSDRYKHGCGEAFTRRSECTHELWNQLGGHPGVWVLGLMVRLCLACRVVLPWCFPPAIRRVFLLPVPPAHWISATAVCVSGCLVVLLNLHVSVTSDRDHLLSCFFAICLSSLEKRCLHLFLVSTQNSLFSHWWVYLGPKSLC